MSTIECTQNTIWKSFWLEKYRQRSLSQYRVNRGKSTQRAQGVTNLVFSGVYTDNPALFEVITECLLVWNEEFINVA